MYKHYWQKDVQCRNLAMLVEQYIWRTDIAMDREAKTLARAYIEQIIKIWDVKKIKMVCKIKDS